MSGTGLSAVSGLIIYVVMQHCSECRFLIATLLEHESGYGMHMREVRHVGPFAPLRYVRLGGNCERSCGSRSKRGVHVRGEGTTKTSA